MSRISVCYWYEDGRGERMLIPGCWSRLDNPDGGPCDCLTVAQQLEQAEEDKKDLERELRSARSWHDQVVRAVYDHPEGIAIMKQAARRAQTEGPLLLRQADRDTRSGR